MLSPLASAEGTLVTAAIRNISVRKKAAVVLLQKVDELKRSNEELGQFAYIASHDLQEPLRMVASYTQLLARRYKGKLDADADEFIAFAVDGASRMQRLIQDLLTYSRVGTKGRDLRHTSSEDAFQQSLVNLRGSIEGSGAVVTHDALPTVLADEMQLTQLFQNLIGNAIKYQTPEFPCPHLRRHEWREEVELCGERQRSRNRPAVLRKNFSACSSGCTNGKSSPHRDWVSHLQKKSSSGTAAAFRSNRSSGTAPPFALP